jgi:putative transposase
MWVRAKSPKPRTTVPEDRSERISFPVDSDQLTDLDQVWGTDITSIPLQKDFFVRVAIIDIFTRHVLSWKPSNSIGTELFLEALEMALEGGRKPGVSYSIQGC